MITGSGIEIPEDLFKAIDKIHAEATEIYQGLDSQALELISPNRHSEQIKKIENIRKNKAKKEQLMNSQNGKIKL